MELLIFESAEEDRRKNPFYIPEGEETENSALAALIRSKFLINLLTSQETYTIFNKMEKEESLSEEAYNIVLLSNALQKANMSSSPHRVDMEELLDELLNRKEDRLFEFQEKSDFQRLTSIFVPLIKNYLKFEKKYVEGEEDDDEKESENDESEDEDKKKKAKETGKKKENDILDFRSKVVDALKKFQQRMREKSDIKDLLWFLTFKVGESESYQKARFQIENFIRILYFRNEKSIPICSNNLLQIYISFPFLYFSEKPISDFLKEISTSKDITPEDEPEEENEVKFWEMYKNLRESFKMLKKFINLASNYSISGIQSKKNSDPEFKEMVTYSTPHLQWMHSPFNETYSISCVSLFSNTGQNVEVIDVKVTDGREVKYFEDVKLSKLDSSRGFNVFDLIKEITDMDTEGKKGLFDHKFYLPSVLIDDSIRTLLIDENRGYELKDYDHVDFHRIPNYNTYDELKSGEIGALYIDLLDEDGNILRTLNCLLKRDLTLNEQFETIHKLFNLYSLNLKSSYIKKNMIFDEDSIGWFNKFGDYIDVVKGFDEKPCCPVFQITLKDIVRRRLKGYKFKKSKESGIGRLGIGDMLKKNIDLSVTQLEKLGINFIN